MIGKQLGAYRIVLELGSGAMGTVYLAEARAEGEGRRRVALKVVHPHLLATPGFFKRFLREAELGRKIVHENVVRTLDVDALPVDDGFVHFLVMEHVEGQTLRSLLDELGRVPEELCRHIAREMGKGLAAIHAAGAVHRDIKPENVLITRDHVVKIMDLGVARVRDDAMNLTQTGGFVGTLKYAAPEQLVGEVPEEAADFYSFGLILYELATGRLPYPVDDMERFVSDRLGKAPRPAAEINPQLSPFFEEVLSALLERDPGERLAFVPDGEESTWWRDRAEQIRTATRRPLRRIRIPRETELYGRDGDLERLRALYEEAAAGSGRVVLIEGEAGIGKTRLADEMVGRLEAEGQDLNFLHGSYPPGGAATAAGAWSTAYREHFGTERLPSALADYLTVTPGLAPAFAALLRGEPPPEGSEPLTKDSLQTVFVHVTRALAAERPTVVVIEDLHFAPEEGRALLASLALAVPGHRILVIGTTRPELPSEWTSNLERLEHVHRLELDRLGPKDLGRLLVDAFGSERLAQELALRIATKSDGNPFFVFEIIRGLREGQLIAKLPDGTWGTTRVIEEIEIPDSVRDLVQARISGLDEEERELLDVAACCGFEFDPLLVGQVLGLADIPLLRRLGHLENAHRIVRSAGLRFVFDHHQVQEALYGAQPELLRRRYHAAIGVALEGRTDAAGPDGARAVDLCEHFLRGDRGEQALRYLDTSLSHLERSYLNDQAVTLADRALSVEGLLAGAPRAELLLKQAAGLDVLGRVEAQGAAIEEALALAREVGESRLLARAHLSRSRCWTQKSRFEEAGAEAERAREFAVEAGDRQGEAHAIGSVANVAYYLGRNEEALERYEHALAILREIGDREREGACLSNRGMVLWTLGRLPEALGHLEGSLAAAREVGDRIGEGRVATFLGLVLHDLGRSDEAREHHEHALEISRELGDRAGEAMALGNLGGACTSLGLVRRALECHTSHLAVAKELGDRSAEAIALVNLGPLYLSLGVPDLAQGYLGRSLEILREIGARRPEGYALQSLARVPAAAGDTARAVALSKEALALRREIGHGSGVAGSLVSLGGTLVEAERFDEARPYLKEALALGRELDSPDTVASAAVHLARLPGADSTAALAVLREYESRLQSEALLDVRYLLWKLTGDGAHLAEARRQLEFLRDHAPEEYRESMIENVPRHRDIAAASQEHGG